MSSARYVAARPPLAERLAYQGRILRVLSRTDFKLKYAGSVLGYVWSLAKPLLYFGVLWVVFGNLFRSQIPKFPIYLILGIVLWTFVSDAITAALPSVVSRASILRRIAFPPIVIPVAATVTALMTFLLNLLVVVVFLGANRIVPKPSWLLLVPLFLELYLFVLGLGLAAAALYVRFRDVRHIWDVLSSILFFSAPVMYPVKILPMWIRPVVGCNPFVQILEDVRRLILGPDAHAIKLLGHHGNHLAPLAVVVVLLATGTWLYQREAPMFAELS
jgi:ABC-2 type transport system permease protein